MTRLVEEVMADPPGDTAFAPILHARSPEAAAERFERVCREAGGAEAVGAGTSIASIGRRVDVARSPSVRMDAMACRGSALPPVCCPPNGRQSTDDEILRSLNRSYRCPLTPQARRPREPDAQYIAERADSASPQAGTPHVASPRS